MMTSAFSLARRRAVFAAASTGYILSQFYRSFLTVVVDDLTRDLAIGPKEFGALGAAWFFAFAALQIPVGIWLDRYGPRRTTVVMMALAVLGAVLFSQATSFWTAATGMALIGAGCAPILMGALYFFGRTEEPGRFAALASVFLGVGLLGGLLAAAPLAYVVSLIGWRMAFLLMAGVTLASLLLIAFVMRDPPAAEQPAKVGSMVEAFLALLKSPGMVPILAMSLVATGPVWTERSLWVGPFFGEVHGLEPLARSQIALAMGVGMTLCALLAGPIAGKLGQPKHVSLAGTLLAGSGFMALAFWPLAPLPLAILFTIQIGLFGATYAVMVGHARLFMPADVLGRGITLVNFINILGTGLMQYASGAMVAHWKAQGLTAPAVYSNLHLMFGMLMLTGALLYSLAPAKPKA
ncbi:MAG: MFS transporter [Methylobacterium sp.]|nr:MFS transporter [Methylobacterium sp.]